jgi:hypothetical protein
LQSFGGPIVWRIDLLTSRNSRIREVAVVCDLRLGIIEGIFLCNFGTKGDPSVSVLPKHIDDGEYHI